MNKPAAQVEIVQAMKRMRENLPVLIEFQQFEVSMTRHKYLALVREGFTEDQALELCKKGTA